MALASSVNGGRVLAPNTSYNRAFFMGTGNTGLSLTVTISKDGAAFGALGGSVSEISSGWYKVALNTADTNTLGDLAYHATDGGTNIEDWSDQVAVLPVVLADGVAHGGTPGSSTATLALKQLDVTNGDNLGNALVLRGGPSGYGVNVEGGNAAAASDNDGGHGLRVVAGAGDGAGSGGEGIRVQGGDVGGNALRLVAGAGTGHDVNLDGDGQLWDGVAGRPVSIRLADATDHGGTPGSSTATIAFSRMVGTSQSSNTAALALAGNGSGAGLSATGGATGAAAVLAGGSTSGDGLTVTTTSGHGFSLDAAGTGKSGLVVTTTAGDGVSVTAAGSGKSGLFLQGGTNSYGLYARGNGTGDGGRFQGGVTGDGLQADGGASAGAGIRALSNGGADPAVYAFCQGGGGAGLLCVGDAAGHDLTLGGDGLVGGSIILTSDLAAVPGASASLAQAVSWLHMLARNKRTQTATTETVYKNDSTTSAATSAKSDDGTVFSRGKYS